MAAKQSPQSQNRPAPWAQTFQRAIAMHQQGKLDQAERLYKAVLAMAPLHFEASYWCGMMFYQQGRNAEALQYIAAAMKAKPADPTALASLALIQAATGRLEEALANYDAALRLKPDHAETFNNRGVALLSAGRSEEAVASFDQAIALKPNYAEALNNRGYVLVTLKRTAEGLASLDSAVALKPDYSEAFNNRGEALRALGRFEEALASFDSALALNPRSAEAANNRGNALLSLQRPREALAAFDAALACDPLNARAHNNRGGAFRDLGRFEEALACYDAALAIDQNYAWAHNNRANVLNDLGRPQEALASYDRALALNANFVEGHDNRGILLVELGRLDEAIQSIKQAIALAPQRIRSYYNLTLFSKTRPGDSHIAAMESLARDMPSLSEGEQIDLNFALGKVFADLGDYERAFPRLSVGNALKRKQMRYHEATALELLARTRRAFPAALIRPGEGRGDPSDIPVFVIGMPRSGTTLVEQILASHPSVHGAGEIKDFQKAAVALGAHGENALRFPEAGAALPDEEISRLGADYVARLRAMAPTATRIVNKTPENFRFLGLIHKALPNARIIHARRDPVDTCVSCFSQCFFEEVPYAYDLGELGRYYRAYEALMAHWRETLPQGSILEVQYEDVVADLEGQARRIVAHCGLDWDQACLDFHQSERSVRTASVTQVRQPIYKNSIGRWRAYEEFLGPLLAELEASTVAPPQGA
jgi:tetratricopeptide (TPR) repeat protein